MDGFGMNEFGLNGSQWAPRSHSGNSKYTRDDGKWTCFMCGCANSLRRRDCLPCSERTTSKNVDYRTIDYSHLHSHPSAASDNEHTRPDEARLDQTAKINGLSGTSNETHSKKLQLREPGLAMSQWAPPGYARERSLDVSWTKVCSAFLDSSMPSNACRFPKSKRRRITYHLSKQLQTLLLSTFPRF